MNQFERDTELLEQGYFVKVSYDHSTKDKRIETSGVVDEIEHDDEYPTVIVECGGGRTLRLTWSLLEYPDETFGVEKVAFQDSILGNEGEIELLHKSV